MTAFTDVLSRHLPVPSCPECTCGWEGNRGTWPGHVEQALVDAGLQVVDRTPEQDFWAWVDRTTREVNGE